MHCFTVILHISARNPITGRPFTTDDHVRLANVLHNIKGRFLLSYNDCPLVHDLYGDCQIEPLTRLNQLPAAGPTEYKELLVCNYL